MQTMSDMHIIQTPDAWLREMLRAGPLTRRFDRRLAPCCLAKSGTFGFY